MGVRGGQERRAGAALPSLERLAAISGVLFFVLIVVTFFLPEAPDFDETTQTIIAELQEDRDEQVLGVFIGYLAAFFFAVFTAGLWSWLRRVEPDRGASLLVLVGGIGSVILVLVANGVFLAMVDAADEGREPAAVRALFELDQWILSAIAVTSAVFYAGAALSALATGALPRSLVWIAAALAIAFPVGLLWIFSGDDEGGALGFVFFIALLINFLWILATSVVMWPARSASGSRVL